MEEKTKTGETKRVLVIFYSLYGHVEKMAKEVAAGINAIPGVKAEIWRIPETLKIVHSDDYPVLTYDKIDELTKADGFLFGMPSRFGIMPAQFRTFLDMTGKLWASGALTGKSAGIFFSTGTQGGGQEVVAMTAITFFTSMGINFVPLGSTFGPELYDIKTVRGSSCYGAGTYSGNDGSREPSDLELRIAKFQGESFAKFIARIKSDNGK